MQPEPGPQGRSQAATALAFRNVLCWRVGATGIELAHQRFGAKREVGLVRLVAAAGYDDAALVSALPHHCGADRYEAGLHLVADGFDLVWRAHGPAKDEVLVHRYRSR